MVRCVPSTMGIIPCHRSLGLFLCALLFFLSGSSRTLAQNRYRFDSWTTENGLPNNWVMAVHQTRDGYLWLTTADGVALRGRNLSRYVQTGLNLGPDFNSYKFHIAETGYAWRLGDDGKPGRIAVGGWHQTGQLVTPPVGVTVNGASGLYAFGSQRLWYLHPGVYSAGLGPFYQFGYSNSNTEIVKRYVGAGLTGIALIPKRPADTMGAGFAWSRPNQTPGAGAFFFPDVPSASTSLRPTEVMWQGYYQAVLVPWKLVLVGAYSSIPIPGERPDIPWAHALTVRLNVLF